MEESLTRQGLLPSEVRGLIMLYRISASCVTPKIVKTFYFKNRREREMIMLRWNKRLGPDLKKYFFLIKLNN